ncbi:hypothetical protein M3Y99_01170600 [Aphelenchoides fujianensis]|nr:hypothetical protein M3Y99_01170600 [Aphelenchoides fujianensis]
MAANATAAPTTISSDFRRRLLVTLVLFSLLLARASAANLKTTCRKVGYKAVIDEHGCDLVAVHVNRCSGYCLSFSFANPLRSNSLSVYARCCRMVDAEMIDVEVTCGGEKKLVKIPSASECGCFDCA